MEDSDSPSDVHGVFDSADEDLELPFVPILLTFAKAPTKIKKISGLAELSFYAGLEGDDLDAWNTEIAEALNLVIDLEKHPNPRWFLRAGLAIHQAFASGWDRRLRDAVMKGEPSEASNIALEYAYRLAEAYVSCSKSTKDFAPNILDRAHGAAAYHLATRFRITAGEAAASAKLAFEANGIYRGVGAIAKALEMGAAGVRDREAAA